MKAAELLAPGVSALAAEIFLDRRSLFVRFSQPLTGAETMEALPGPNCFLRKRGGWFVRYQGLESVYPLFDGFAHTHTLLGYPHRGCLPRDLLRCVSVLQANPEQVQVREQVGPYSMFLAEGFSGFTLVELAVLNRYRKRGI